MEQYIKILIGVGVLIFYVARAINKAKAEQKKSNPIPQARREPLEPISNDQLDRIFELEKSQQTQQEKIIKAWPEKKPSKKTSLTTKSQSPAMEMETDEHEEVHPFLKDFDAQKAIIYSEILKPPYL